VGEIRLMLVEDEDAIVRPLTSALSREGFRIERFATAEEALEVLQEPSGKEGPLPDVIVLDIGLPGMSGLELCRIVRENWPIPVVMLTARGETIDRVLGLELGADDYLTKPFSSRELVSRIRALLRRAAWRKERSSPLVIGDLRVDEGRREVKVGTSEVALTPREFDLLAYLATRSPAVVRRDELMREVWDAHWDGSTQTLDVHVATLRGKIEPNPHRPRFVHTVRGVGYQVRDGCAAG
jgi:DNA-binding response OmpR family regulator